MEGPPNQKMTCRAHFLIDDTKFEKTELLAGKYLEMWTI